jgi:hypothetical protein
LRALQSELAGTLAEPSEAYRVMDTTLVPAIVRARACRGGLFAGQASFGRCRSKTEWVYGFKVALVVSPEGVVTAFFLAPATCDERPIGEALIAEDRHPSYRDGDRVVTVTKNVAPSPRPNREAIDARGNARNTAQKSAARSSLKQGGNLGADQAPTEEEKMDLRKAQRRYRP